MFVLGVVATPAYIVDLAPIFENDNGVSIYIISPRQGVELSIDGLIVALTEKNTVGGIIHIAVEEG